MSHSLSNESAQHAARTRSAHSLSPFACATIKAKKTQRGFTLIELIVVIVILGILAATALPKYMDMRREARIAALKGMEATIRDVIILSQAAFALADRYPDDYPLDAECSKVGTGAGCRGHIIDKSAATVFIPIKTNQGTFGLRVSGLGEAEFLDTGTYPAGIPLAALRNTDYGGNAGTHNVSLENMLEMSCGAYVWAHRNWISFDCSGFTVLQPEDDFVLQGYPQEGLFFLPPGFTPTSYDMRNIIPGSRCYLKYATPNDSLIPPERTMVLVADYTDC